MSRRRARQFERQRAFCRGRRNMIELVGQGAAYAARLVGVIWRPAIEILILAVIIYYVFTFVRGTRGFSILTGFLVVLLTLALVSNFFDFNVLKFLLGTFSAFL